MQLISPDVLVETKGLSIGATGILMFVGLMLWAFGWRWHRFWVAFTITLTAGIVGLNAGQASGNKVMVIGVLLAIAAGLLALELAKIIAFLTGGIAAWIGVQALLPQAQELWAVFFCGGLLGVVLYRFWTMLATSFVGAVLFSNTLAIMAETFAPGKLTKIIQTQQTILNLAIFLGTILGVYIQSKTGAGIHGGLGVLTEDAEYEASPRKSKQEEEHDTENTLSILNRFRGMLSFRKAA